MEATDAAAAPAASDDGGEKPWREHTQTRLYQLTTALIHTYNHINKNYYQKRSLAGIDARKKKAEKSVGDYPISTNEEIFCNRYRVCGERLGSGSYGQVVAAVDLQTGESVAIKILKKNKRFMTEAQTEMGILNMLHQHTGHPGRKLIVHLQNSFIHQGHQCLVFERLGSSLYDILLKSKFRGYGLSLVRKFAAQIIEALDYLAHPTINVIHCDLKPENILLVHDRKSNLKIIDFGSSCLSQKQLYPYIQSRFYRAPEVLLGMKYSCAIDVWSLACVLVEMYTGKPLFKGSDAHDQLRRIIRILGMPPRELIDQATHRKEFFDEIAITDGVNRVIDYRLKVRKSPKKTMVDDTPRTLSEVIEKDKHGSADAAKVAKESHSPYEFQLFLDLIQRMLDYNPATRIKPSEALEHPFLLIKPRRSSDTKEKKSKLMRSNYMADVSGEMWDQQAYSAESDRIFKQRRLHPSHHDAGH